MKLLRFAPAVLGLWTVYLLASFTIFATVFGAELVPLLICGGAVATMALITLVVALIRRRRGTEVDRGPRAVPDLSFPTVMIGASVFVAVMGTEWAPWAALIGAGIFLVGLGGLVREYRAQREAQTAALGAEEPATR